MKTLLQPAVWCGLLLFFLFGTLGCTQQTPATVSADSSGVDDLPESITVDVQKPESLDTDGSDIANSNPSDSGAADSDTAGLDGEDPSLSFDDEPAAELLAVGSKAPALDIENWVSDGHGKFKPVTTFEAGKAYVVEFWATWCGPCVQSMPHLVELQEKYADKDLQIISVSDEALGTVEGFLQRGYSGGGEDGPQTYADLTSAYCLTTDPDRSVHTAYMEAAGQNGIPTAFIVGKTGEIEWIGHPMTMDGPLGRIVSDNWDREAFAENERLMGQIQQLAQQGKTDEAMKLIEQAKATADEAGLAQLARMTQQIKLAPIGLMIQSGDLAGAITAIGEVIDTADEEMLPQLQFTRLAMMIQLKQDDEAATAIGELTETMDAKFLDSIAWNVYQRASQEEEFSQPLLDAATAASEKAMEKAPEETSILDTLAHLMELQGDLDRAIELATKAAENAPEEIKEKLQGYVEELQAAKADPVADAE